MAGHSTLLRQLLPPVAYDSASSSLLGAQLDAEGAALDTALADAVGVVMGINPFNATDWISDWERVYGLPDACARDGQTWQERIAALALLVIEQGGISKAYFVKVAAVFGYTISIAEYSPFCAGSRAGDALTNGDWYFAWCVETQANTSHAFCAGASVAGEPLTYWSDEVLECIMERLKPAHTVVLFRYI